MADVRIAPVASSAFTVMDIDEEEKATVEGMAVKFREATNWFARKKLFLDLLEELDATASAAVELAESPEFAEFLSAASAELAKEQSGRASSPAAPTAQPGADHAGGRPDDLPDLDEEALDEFLPEDPFAVIVPLYVGAILERLGEQDITCLEQAAFYFLSMHPEHQEAAQAWLNAGPRRLRAFRTFIRANPAYDAAAQRVIAEEMVAEEGDEA